MLLFLDVSKTKGLALTWIAAGAAGSGNLPEFCAAAASCVAAVSWDIEAKMDALIRLGEKAGADTGALKSLNRVEMALLTLAPRSAGAAAIEAVYMAAGHAAVLPPGGKPTPEQWAIIGAFEQRSNIVCRAVAGAGKTTTLLLCAARRPAASCLLLTYNKQLQVAASARARGLPVRVSTYHSAAGHAYGCTVSNDEIFRRCVTSPPETPPVFDVLMVDEAQDMTLEYFLFVRYLLRARPAAQIIVVGDELQAINEYRGARPEFLTEARRLYSSAGAWVECRLSTSQRLTPETARFVNRHLYGADIIVGGNLSTEGHLPIYMSARSKDGVARLLASAVKTAVGKYGPEGVFVLSPSIRNLTTSASPIADLVRRHLVGIPSYVAGQDETMIDADLIRGKLAIMSYNASKGCERRCVVLVGLDETYFDYYDRAWDRSDALPNVITVAATRASHQLVVVANCRRTIRTAVMDALGADAHIFSEGTARPLAPRVRARPPEKKHTLSVTDLVRHLHPETVRLALSMVAVREGAAVRDPAHPISRAAACGAGTGLLAPAKIQFGDFYEDLAFVYGIIAPVLAEVKRTGTSSFASGLEAPKIVKTAGEVRPYSADITEREYEAYPDDFWAKIAVAVRTDPARRSLAEWARLAVARNALEDGYHHLARQVPHYDWLEAAPLNDARDTILQVLAGAKGRFEVRLPEAVLGNITIVGRADFVEAAGGGPVLWEFKYASECREENTLQLACYLALRGGGEGVLFSVQRRESYLVAVEPENARPLLSCLAKKVRDPPPNIFSLVGGVGPAAAEEPAPNQYTADDLFS